DAAAAPLVNLLTQVVDLKAKVYALAAEPSPSFTSIANVLDSTDAVFTALRKVETQGTVPALARIGEDLVQLLVGTHLAAAHPLLFRLGVLLTLIERAEDAEPTDPIVVNGEIVRDSIRIARIHPERLAGLIRDPLAALKAEYVNDLATVADADAMADKLFLRLAGVLTQLGVPWRYGLNDQTRPLPGDAAPLVGHGLTIPLAQHAAGPAPHNGVH